MPGLGKIRRVEAIDWPLLLADGEKVSVLPNSPNFVAVGVRVNDCCIFEFNVFYWDDFHCIFRFNNTAKPRLITLISSQKKLA
jgi:hypothetical protein